MTKRRRQGWMLFLAGLLLLAGAWLLLKLLPGLDTTCLLYTSDAADEL